VENFEAKNSVYCSHRHHLNAGGYDLRRGSSNPIRPSRDDPGRRLCTPGAGKPRNIRCLTILSKTGITDVYASSVVGNVGTSPITGAAVLLTCGEVTGYIYTVDAAGPFPCRVTDATRLPTAIGDMEAAYNDAAGRVNPDVLNLRAGEIGGLTCSRSVQMEHRSVYLR
jgi:hypothetical protein